MTSLPEPNTPVDGGRSAHNVLLSAFTSALIFCFSMTASSSVDLLASCEWWKHVRPGEGEKNITEAPDM